MTAGEALVRRQQGVSLPPARFCALYAASRSQSACGRFEIHRSRARETVLASSSCAATNARTCTCRRRLGPPPQAGATPNPRDDGDGKRRQRAEPERLTMVLFLDVSWGEVVLVVGVGLAMVGKQDLPRVARLAGTQLGRVVGLLQGARARADRLSAQSELRQLQHELRLGLRELDAVKAELAVSLSGPGLMQPLPPPSNAPHLLQQQQQLQRGGMGGAGDLSPPAPTASAKFDGPSETAFAASSPSVDGAALSPSSPHSPSPLLPLPPVSQTVAAVAEDEWVKRGMAFQSRAERGAGMLNSGAASYDPTQSGSILLETLLRQSLVFDQYERAVRDQDRVLQLHADRIQQQVRQQVRQQQQQTGDGDSASHSPATPSKEGEAEGPRG